MHKSELKKIFYDFSFIKEPMSILKILDTITVNPTESMKHILCRMQNNEDLDFIFNEVIKLIDTQSVNLKFYTNLYLKVYTKNNPIRQLLCVNTFLKDLSDKSDVIKKSTLKVIESIKDEVILSNYKNKIKNIKNESKEIKIQKLMIMSEIEIEDLNEFIKSGDPEMNYKGIEKMCDILIKKGGNLKGGSSKVGGDKRENGLNRNRENTLSKSRDTLSNPQLNNPHTLNIPPSHTPSHINPSHLNTPILDLINRNLNNPKSLYFLIKLAYLKNLQISPFLNFNYLPLFFYSSLISNDKQSIYNLSLLFLKSSYEKVYHILLFQESLLDFVDYENSNYLIYEEDPFYIKTQKVKMLFYKLDDISIYELTRQSKGELREVILENGIKKGFIIEGVLYEDLGGCGSRVDKGFRNLPSSNLLPSTNTHNTHNSIINILFNNFPFSLNYSYLIKNYLLSINPHTLNQDSFKKYLYLVGKVCDDYEIVDLDKVRDIDLINPILKFYISFFKRKILSEEKFIEIIRGLKKKEKFKEKAKVLLNLINLKGPYVLFDFEEENGSKEEEGGNKVKLEIYEDVKEGGSKVDGKNLGSKGDDNKSDIKDNPLLICKPYNPTSNFNPLPTLKESLSNNPSLSNNNPFIFKGDDWSFNNNSFLNNGDLIIDTFLLKGTLSLTKEDIKLEIDILERPLKIKFGIEDFKNEILIEKEEIIILHKIEIKDIDKKFKMGIISEIEGSKRDNGRDKGKDKGDQRSKGNLDNNIQVNSDPIINPTFNLRILKENLITPYDCPLSLFENEFKRFKNYKIIEKLDEKLVKRIDLNSFTFKILGKIVYGKNFCDQVVIKGEKEVMEIF